MKFSSRISGWEETKMPQSQSLVHWVGNQLIASFCSEGVDLEHFASPWHAATNFTAMFLLVLKEEMLNVHSHGLQSPPTLKRSC